jgi:hypothetical protein
MHKYKNKTKRKLTVEVVNCKVCNTRVPERKTQWRCLLWLSEIKITLKHSSCNSSGT